MGHDDAVVTVTQASGPTIATSLTPTATKQPITPTVTVTATAVEVTAVYVVGNTDGDGVYIRRTPDVADGIKAWPDGTVMEIIGPDVPAQERLWKQVVDPDGTVGFIPVEYLLTLQEAVATGAAELPEATPPVAQTVFVLPRVAEPPDDLPAYSRASWQHWIDADVDCQDARQEVLIEESLESVAFRTARECRVEDGSWIGPYTGLPYTDPSNLDVDHMVPLANAHHSGAWAWDAERKREYANDLSYAGHLIAVQASANRSKGSKGPEAWKPPLRSYWCAYAVDWATIKVRWDLTATASEIAALKEMLATCSATPQIQEPTPAATATPAHLPAAATIAPSPTNARPPTFTPALSPTYAPPPTFTPLPLGPRPLYDPHGPDRDCGDFSTWQQANVFYRAAGGPDSDRHGLDRDRDGIPCQSLPGAP